VLKPVISYSKPNTSSTFIGEEKEKKKNANLEPFDIENVQVAQYELYIQQPFIY